jgi:glycosyltransferase involved in cell wall biosynthesis
MTPFFSLIIPVYNVEKYLANCLDSCINQTFTDIEIICINDCSPDKCSIILDEYAKKDSRIKIITHEKNKCLGGARNTGIAVATGEYSWFIDSDDMIPLDACELLFSIINKTNAHIIRFNMINFQHDDSWRLGIYTRIDECGWLYDKIITKKDHIRIGLTEVTACTFITITSQLKKIKFRELVFHEDADYVPILFSETESIYCINAVLYFRRLHDKSITGGGVPIQNHIVYKLYAINSLCKYVTASKLPKSHFCVKNLKHDVNYIKKEYYKYPEIHNVELNTIISRAEKIKSSFVGDLSIYNDIIANYGNTRLLVFILKVYRFIIKRIRSRFTKW